MRKASARPPRRGLASNAHPALNRAIMARGAQGDAKEGVMSFLEKRAPAYPDKVSADLPDIWPYWDKREFK